MTSLTVLAILLGLLAQSFRKFARNTEALKTEQEVRTELGRLLAHLLDAESAHRGFLLTSQSWQLSVYDRATEEFPKCLSRLRAAYRPPSDASLFQKLEEDANAHRQRLSQTLALAHQGRLREAAAALRAPSEFQTIRSTLHQLIAQQESQVRKRVDEVEYHGQFVVVFMVGATLALATAGVSGLALRRGAILRRLREQQRDRTLASERAARVALEASEHRYRFLADNVPPLVWTATPAGTVDYLNRRWETMGGANSDEPSVDFFAAVLHPDDREPFRNSWAFAVKNGAAYESECRLRRHDGTYRWHLVRALPMLSTDGSVIRWVGTCTDIQEQKKTLHENERLIQQLATERERLEAVMRSLPVAVMICDAPSGAVAFANRQLQRILGEPGWAPSTAKDLLERWRPKERSGVAPRASDFPVHRALFDRATILGEEIELRRSDGQSAFLRVNAAPVLDQRGEVASAVIVLEDVTAEHRAAEAREQMDRFREQFLGILGHDLRNPLNAVLLGSELLIRGRNSPQQQLEVANRIRNSAKRMQGMVSQLLDYARTRLGSGIPVHVHTMNLGQLTRQVVEELETAFPRARFLLQTEGDLTGEWDADRMAQLVANLASNAVKHGDSQLPVELSLRGESERICLSVRNYGNPIPPELVPQLFEPYRRGREAESNHSDGLGLGLFISKEIVRAHGGRIEVHSGPQFTVFTVEVPRRASKERAQPVAM